MILKNSKIASPRLHKIDFNQEESEVSSVEMIQSMSMIKSLAFM